MDAYGLNPQRLFLTGRDLLPRTDPYRRSQRPPWYIQVGLSNMSELWGPTMPIPCRMKTMPASVSRTPTSARSTGTGFKRRPEPRQVIQRLPRSVPYLSANSSSVSGGIPPILMFSRTCSEAPSGRRGAPPRQDEPTGRTGGARAPSSLPARDPRVVEEPSLSERGAGEDPKPELLGRLEGRERLVGYSLVLQ